MTLDKTATCNADRRESCTRHGERIATLEANTTTIMSGVDEIKECLMGNGNDGLKIEVDRNTRGREQAEAQAKAAKGRRFKVVVVVLGTGLTLLSWIARVPIEHWFEKHL